MTFEKSFSESSLRCFYLWPFAFSRNMYTFLLSATVSLAAAICAGLADPITSLSAPATTPFVAN